MYEPTNCPALDSQMRTLTERRILRNTVMAINGTFGTSIIAVGITTISFLDLALARTLKPISCSFTARDTSIGTRSSGYALLTRQSHYSNVPRA